MTKVKVSIEGHYEVHEISYGKDYRWVPAHAPIECDCGQVMDADSPATPPAPTAAPTILTWLGRWPGGT